MIGQLFTQDFLSTGIADTPVWKSVMDADLDEFVNQVKAIYAQFKADSNLNESLTENQIIIRVLSKLGWTDILTQQIASKSRRADIPDMLLLPDAAAKAAALKEKREDRRFRHGILIVESKSALPPGNAVEYSMVDRRFPGKERSAIGFMQLVAK